MQSGPVQSIDFDPDLQASAVHVPTTASASDILDRLALPSPNALVILNGGTAQLEPPLQAQLGALLIDGLARIAAEEQITLVTGGTDAGIFHLLGQGLAKWGRTAPCIGVAVDSLVTWPGDSGGEAPLESHHSHFVLVDGSDWGDETAAMYALAEDLSAGCANLAVFAGGGEIAIHEMQQNVVQGRILVMLRGSGRSTDGVLDALAGHPVQDERLAAIAHDGRISPVDIRQGPHELAAVVRTLLHRNG